MLFRSSVVAGPVVVGVIGVTNGLFSTEIDFGAGAFPGDFARYLEVGVRRAGSGAAYEVFSRRQKINRVPFSQEANHAAAANSLVIQGGLIKVSGATTNSATPVFIHTANKNNIVGNYTTIDNPYCNNDPGALLFITHNWSADKATDLYVRAHAGVFYLNGKWAI